MSYVSLAFAAFFAILIIVYYLMPKKYRWTVLLLGSIVFYLFSGVKYILYVLACAVTTYGAAMLSHKNKKDFAAKAKALKEQLSPDDYKKEVKRSETRSRLCLFAALLVDLGILIVLKYLNFILANINVFLPADHALPHFSFIMPLGLSFYTFSAVGYIVDVTREKYEPERNFFKFFLFLSFFPQIIQGPIPSYTRLAHQLYEGHDLDFKNIRDGFQLVLWGIFKKLVIADAVAAIVINVVGEPGSYSGLELWLAMFIWGIQIYADFSGGVDVSRGVSQMLGITLDLNFTRPYFATNLNDFWNRWHISLGAWLKDYFFYPIALSKSFSKFTKWNKKKFGKFAAKTVPVGLLSLFLFTIVGIWHGANWGEVLFGVYNGVVILISTLCEPLFIKFRKAVHADGSLVYRVLCSLRTCLLITIARIFSRPANIGLSGLMFKKMFGFGGQPFFHVSADMLGGNQLIMFLPALIACILLFFVSIIEEKGHSIRDLINAKPLAVGLAITLVGILTIVIFGAYGIGFEAANFIYSNY